MARNEGRWGQVLTAMVTPMHDDGSVDYDGVAALARYLQDNGNDGLVVTGTTGESPVVTDEERVTIWQAAAEAVTIPIIAGSGTNDTAHSVEMTKAAKDVGAAGILAVTPYYNRPSQAGLYGHFKAIADATDLPVMLYDIPIRTRPQDRTRDVSEVDRGLPEHRGQQGRREGSVGHGAAVPRRARLLRGVLGRLVAHVAVPRGRRVRRRRASPVTGPARRRRT